MLHIFECDVETPLQAGDTYMCSHGVRSVMGCCGLVQISRNGVYGTNAIEYQDYANRLVRPQEVNQIASVQRLQANGANKSVMRNGTFHLVDAVVLPCLYQPLCYPSVILPEINNVAAPTANEPRTISRLWNPR